MTQLLTRRELCDRLRIGRSTGDKLLHSGFIRSVRIGRRVLIPASEIERLSLPTS